MDYEGSAAKLAAFATKNVGLTHEYDIHSDGRIEATLREVGPAGEGTFVGYGRSADEAAYWCMFYYGVHYDRYPR